MLWKSAVITRFIAIEPYGVGFKMMVFVTVDLIKLNGME